VAAIGIKKCGVRQPFEEKDNLKPGIYWTTGDKSVKIAAVCGNKLLINRFIEF